MIRRTTEASPGGVLSAYKDNAAVIEGTAARALLPRSGDRRLPRARASRCTSSMKVETHNHPTAISPFPGAATGSGGEIRDEGATGRGGKPKAGLIGFSRLEPAPARRASSPGRSRPRQARSRSPRALDIMIDGPLGGAAFNNEFGRPALLRLLPHLRAGGRRADGPRGARLPQADHARGRPRQHPRRARAEGRRSRPARRSSCSAGRRC